MFATINLYPRAQKFLESQGLPSTDNDGLQESEARFPDGASYRIEVPTINSVGAMRKLLDVATKQKFVVNRASITYGIMRYNDDEIRDMLKVARDHGIEIMMMVGPRAPLDIGVQAHLNTLNAHHIGYRVRGTEQLAFALEDVYRAVDLGCRGFIACDEGVLVMIDTMRKSGEIPADVQIKASVLLGTANVAHYRMLEKLGADSINVQRDLPLALLGGFRRGSSLPIDVHANNPGQTGGFVRTYEVPAMIKITAPIYVKTGNIAVPLHSMMVDDSAGLAMAREVGITVDTIRKYLPDAVQTAQGDPGLAIPEL
jgi:hypothetical protein